MGLWLSSCIDVVYISLRLLKFALLIPRNTENTSSPYTQQHIPSVRRHDHWSAIALPYIAWHCIYIYILFTWRYIYMTCKWGLHDICIPSHCIRSKYSVLHDITWHCIALHDMSVPEVTHITLYGLTLHCIAAHYIALQYIASHGIAYHVKTWSYVPFCFIDIMFPLIPLHTLRTLQTLHTLPCIGPACITSH